MGISIQRRRGTTTDHSFFTGNIGEITVDTTKWTAVIHDGTTAGGHPLALGNHTHPDANGTTDGFLSAADYTALTSLISIVGDTINYQTIQSNGTAKPQEEIINFSPAFSLTDDSGGNRTSVDLTSVVSPGTYTKVTVNSKGQVTTGTTLSAGDIPNITASQISDFATAVETTPLNELANPNSDVNVNSFKIVNLASPSSSSDAATKGYVDTVATGLSFKASCRAASPGANINIAAPGTSIDTVTLSSGDRVLLKDQSTATQNGIYVFNGASTPLTRALDAAVSGQLTEGTFVLVDEGTVNGDTGFVISTGNPITIGSTNITFVGFSSGGGSAPVAGNGITVSGGNVVSVHTASSSRIAVSSSGVDLAVVSSVTPGTYSTFTVDAYGRITATTSTAYQVSNTNLTALAAISTTGLIAQTGTGTVAPRTLQPGYGISLLNADGVSGNPQISVVDGSSIQKINVSNGGVLESTYDQLNFIAGTGITVNVASNGVTSSSDVTISTSGSGSGAPTTDEYLLLAADSANLSNSRTLAVSSPIVATDGGSGGTYTLAFTMDWGTVP